MLVCIFVLRNVVIVLCECGVFVLLVGYGVLLLMSELEL